MKPSWRQLVMCFVVIEPRKLDAIQPTLALADNAGRGIATARSTHVLCKTLAYLRNRDRWRPLFSPL